MLKKQDEWVGAGFIWLRIETRGESSVVSILLCLDTQQDGGAA
jgi:hypothetical protein